jgi:hypothetical protein
MASNLMVSILGRARSGTTGLFQCHQGVRVVAVQPFRRVLIGTLCVVAIAALIRSIRAARRDAVSR